MRVAALYDIHGNLPALEAVLAELLELDVDHIVIGGDVVPGPLPRETLAALSRLPESTDFIVGNGENDVLAAFEGGDIDRVPEQFRGDLRWTGAALRSQDMELLATWPDTVTLDLPPLGRVMFCHATPRSDAEIFTRVTPESRLAATFDAVDADIVVCGHTHMQFDRHIGDVRVVNAGSVGMPFGEAGAYWLLVGSDVELRTTSFDLSRAAARIVASDYPRAEEFAKRNVLRPPSEEQMLGLFEQAALR